VTLVWAEFEEKGFEIAAAIELAAGGTVLGNVFSPGQVLEAILGYDAAAAPDSTHPVWDLLRVPRPPGDSLVPAAWHGGLLPRGNQLPTSPVSLILQYKRPEFLRNGRASQWGLWRRPYFRFARTRDQQAVLRRLERRLVGDAIVRYAAPAFWTMADLEGAQLSGTVLARTGFVSPTMLGSHAVWTYREPGTTGFGNPRSRRLPFDTLDTLLRPAFHMPLESSDLIVRESGIRSHLRNLADAASYSEPRLRAAVGLWVSDLSKRTKLQAGVLAELQDLVLVVSVLSRIDAGWFILE
jgi:hypothetical protein